MLTHVTLEGSGSICKTQDKRKNTVKVNSRSSGLTIFMLLFTYAGIKILNKYIATYRSQVLPGSDWELTDDQGGVPSCFCDNRLICRHQCKLMVTRKNISIYREKIYIERK